MSDTEKITNSIIDSNSMTPDIATAVAKLTSTRYASDLASNMGTIEWLCFFNLTFLAQHVVTLIYTQKMGRFYDFPSVLHFTDFLLCVLSLIIINWKQTKLFANLDQAVTEIEY